MRVLRIISTYEFPDEAGADGFILETRQKLGDSITKYSKERKEKRSKGEVIAEAYVVVIQEDYGKVFDDLGQEG